MKENKGGVGALGRRDTQRDIFRSEQAAKRAKRWEREEVPVWGYRSVSGNKGKQGKRYV